MAVPCPHCGRGYDATLFQFGRTISCTCGSRVGIEPRVIAAPVSGPKRFIADAMLGRLARWLRLLGFDCTYESGIADAELVRRGIQEQRIILSRDRMLPEEFWVAGIHLLRSEGFKEQLAEVLAHFELAGELRVLSRCSECNRPLQATSSARVAGRVPERVLRTQEAFQECPECRRVYWEGAHTDRIRHVVDQLLAEAGPQGSRMRLGACDEE